MKKQHGEYQYTIILRKADEGGYIADVPMLPGCMTQGETIDEAISFVKDAIDLYIQTLIQRGKKIPVEEGNVIAHVRGKIPRARKNSFAHA